MLETLVSVANFIKIIVYSILYYSYTTGNVLVNFISVLVIHLSKFTLNLATLFTVLCESISLFCQDILQFFQQLFTFIGNGFDSVYTSIYLACSKISTFITTMVNLVIYSYAALLNIITIICTSLVQLVTFLKKVIILFGSGVWFLLTLLPFLLFYLCKLFVTFIQTTSYEIKEIFSSGVSGVKVLVKNIIFFVIDVPIESLAGLIVALSLAYIIKQFYVLIASYVKLKLCVLKNWYQRRLINLSSVNETINIRRNDNGVQEEVNDQNEPVRRRRALRSTMQVVKQLQPTSTNTKKLDSSFNGEKYCIICQEQTKCILLLPCKHVCLCEGCLRELRYYNETCPICRTDITSTMKIYI